MKKCPLCSGELVIIDVNSEGYDVLGCENCAWEDTYNNDDDMKYFI